MVNETPLLWEHLSIIEDKKVIESEYCMTYSVVQKFYFTVHSVYVIKSMQNPKTFVCGDVFI